MIRERFKLIRLVSRKNAEVIMPRITCASQTTVRFLCLKRSSVWIKIYWKVDSHRLFYTVKFCFNLRHILASIAYAVEAFAAVGDEDALNTLRWAFTFFSVHMHTTYLFTDHLAMMVLQINLFNLILRPMVPTNT